MYTVHALRTGKKHKKNECEKLKAKENLYIISSDIIGALNYFAKADERSTAK